MKKLKKPARNAVRISLIIPTLREARNLEILLPQVCKVLRSSAGSFEVVIVDDNSGDGTDRVVRRNSRGSPVRLIIRKDETGLSSAVLRGFKEARGEAFIVMDADLSHPPALLAEIAGLLKKGYDLVLPSRYMKGGGVEVWPFDRRILSWGATLMARFLTPVKDPMSGYFGLKRSVVDGVRLDPVGFKILLEILVRGHYDRKSIVEIPYIFKNRNIGSSKLDGRVSGEYLKHLWKLYSFAVSSVFKVKGKK